jgi:DNA ligase-1
MDPTLCIIQAAKEKDVSLEKFINDSQLYGYSKLNFPLGIYGKPVYPTDSKTITKNGSFYVPGLEVMTGVVYTDRKIISGRDKETKNEYSVPDGPVGWWVSEKFDGQRAVWDGEKFVSRNSTGDPRVYPYVPIWFQACMPPGIALDGELYLGRNRFSETTSILKKGLKPESQRTKRDTSQEELDKLWINVQYRVFDTINENLFEERQQQLKEIVKERCFIWENMSIPFYLVKGSCPLILTQQYKITSEKRLIELYDKLVAEDAEGVMVRAPGIPYIPRRTKMLLKMKLIADADCVIIGYKPGEGKYTGKLGSFYCQDTISKKKFYISGMNDSIRLHYKVDHPIGTILVYTFNGLTTDLIPRHPRYKGIRND